MNPEPRGRRLHRFYAVAAYAASLLSLAAVAAQVALVVRMNPPAQMALLGEMPEFTRFVMARAEQWPLWFGLVAGVSLALALLAWWRARSAESRHFMLVMLALLNFAIALNIVMAIVQAYFVAPQYREPARIAAEK